MFSGCPSVCACVHACATWRRHSPTGLLSISSCLVVCLTFILKNGTTGDYYGSSDQLTCI